MSEINPVIEASWKRVLDQEFKKTYFNQLKDYLLQEKQAGQTIYPPGSQIFNAFAFCGFQKLKVVILGQDPYHGPGQAHGLCFSVPYGIPAPPSLVNIFKEIAEDCQVGIPNHGNLEKWAHQGILLLNTSLTVRARQAGSHSGHGWEQFTDSVIQTINKHRENVVFLLWGKHAQNKADMIDSNKHLVLSAAHPSPFSVHRGFFGCKHFSKTNQYLKSCGVSPIDWALESINF